MMLDFALHLSPDGIALDQRTHDGWLRLGEVAFDSETLASDLAALREKGGDAMKVKLVLPDEQIRWMDLALTTQPDDIATAFDGATPYSVDELAIDNIEDGGRILAAAVAKETLKEAQVFAETHGFLPLAYVALPQSASAPELFFGGPEGSPATRDPSPYRRAEPAPIPVATPDASETPAEDTEEQPEAELPPKSEAAKDDTAPLPLTTSAPPPYGKDSAAPKVSSALASDAASAGAARPLGAPSAPEPAPKSAPPVSGASSDTASYGRLSGLSIAARDTLNPTDGPRAGPALADESAPQDAIAATAEPQIGGKPRFLLLILLTGLLVLMAGAAAFAAAARAPVPVLSWLFPQDRGIAVAPEDLDAIPLEDAAPIAQAPIGERAPEVSEVSLITPEEAGLEPITAPSVPESIALPLPDDLAMPDVFLPSEESAQDLALVRRPSFTETEAHYAETGVWMQSPGVRQPPQTQSLDRLYIASIDPNPIQNDAVALPTLRLNGDLAPARVASPAAFGTEFVLDGQGLVTPSEDGTLAPGGFLVVLGPPPVRPPLRSPGIGPEAQVDPTLALAALRPALRPEDVIERQERAALGGRTKAEFAALRASLRPPSASELAAETNPEDLIRVTASIRPAVRTEDAIAAALAAVAKRNAETQSETAPQQTQVAAVAPRQAQPSVPTVASVAAAATIDNAINLRRINLIGIYGTEASREALVRLANGRMVKLKVGDRLDGGQVAAIGSSTLRYTKRGQTITLEFPAG